MFVLAALAMSTAFVQTPAALQNSSAPVIWLNPQGSLLVNGELEDPNVSDGVDKVRTPFGVGYDFHGGKSGIRFKDQASFKMTKSFTISSWMNVRVYAPNGQQSQVLFRGDDRNGYDSYWLVILKDGTVNFGLGNEKNESTGVGMQIPLNQWTHVVGSFNGDTGELSLYLDGVKVATQTTDKHPEVELEEKEAPGIGIGNVQNDKGPHNQPFNGILADVRLYGRALGPAQVGYQFKTLGITSGGKQP